MVKIKKLIKIFNMKTITLNEDQIQLLIADSKNRVQQIDNNEYWLHQEKEQRNEILNKLKN